MDRRTFLHRTAAFAAGGLAWTRLGHAGTVRADMADIGLQLYTLRSVLADDFAGTLERVADVGYVNLEFAGYYDHSPAEIKGMLDDLGLVARAGHFGLGELEDDAGAVIDGAATLGMEYVIVPSLPGELRSSLDGYRSVASTFNELGEQCREAGLQFGYHNHSFEFEAVDGQLPYDILLDETDEDLVVMELDIAWITNAGQDPLAYFDRYPGRFHLWHVKDITEGGELADVGDGRIDWPTLFEHAEQSGLRYGIVEHDRPGDDPVASIAASYAYLDGVLD